MKSEVLQASRWK